MVSFYWLCLPCLFLSVCFFWQCLSSDCIIVQSFYWMCFVLCFSKDCLSTDCVFFLTMSVFFLLLVSSITILNPTQIFKEKVSFLRGPTSIWCTCFQTLCCSFQECKCKAKGWSEERWSYMLYLIFYIEPWINKKYSVLTGLLSLPPTTMTSDQLYDSFMWYLHFPIHFRQRLRWHRMVTQQRPAKGPNLMNP